MKLIAFDVETTGALRENALQPFKVRTGESWLSSFAFASFDKEGGVRTHSLAYPTVGDLRKFLKGCAEAKRVIVGWNTAFDIAWLIAMGLRQEVYANRWLDGLALYRHLTNEPLEAGVKARSYGLKAAVAKYLPQWADYEKDVDFHDLSDPAKLSLLRRYNELDAQFTLILTDMFLKQFEPFDGQKTSRKQCVLIEAMCLPMLAEAMVEGVRIDRDAAQELQTKLDNDRKVTFVKMQMAMPGVDAETLASPKKLAHLLYSEWGLPIIKHTETGAASTDKEALAELAAMDERAGMIHQYREAVYNRTKFADGPLESLDYNGDGFVRPVPRMFGTYTGRMTYSSKQGKGKDERPIGVALHQWKRDPMFRKLIIPPEGYTLLEFDFAGQEFRWMAVLSNDSTMLSLCEPGQDAHAYMGARIWGHTSYKDMLKLLADGDPEAKRHRQLGKVANLSLQYRTSPGTLAKVAKVQHGIQMTDAQARAIHATYLVTYPAVRNYWHRQINMLHNKNCVMTLAGRTIFRPAAPWSALNQWSRESTAINFPIQGAGADQKYLALAVMRDYLPKVDGRFYFELHDGLFFVVPNDKAERAVHEMAVLLSSLPYEKAWGVSLPIPFPVDAKMGPSWGELKVVEV